MTIAIVENLAFFIWIIIFDFFSLTIKSMLLNLTLSGGGLFLLHQ